MKNCDTTQYAQDVVNGKYIVGKLVYRACQRHLDDLERSGTEEFPYIFDKDRAERIFKFYSFLNHIKGPLARTPIILAPFQKFILGSVFGWVHQDTDLRRFRKVYVEVARKNAKSTITSGVGLYELGFDKEVGAEVYATAPKRDQAKIVFDDARFMALMNAHLESRLNITRDKIEHPKTNSKFVALSKDSKTADGFNPSLAILDEYHAHPTSDMYDVMISGQGMRTQPLLWIITTAGFTIGGPCHKESEYCTRVINKDVENEEYFIYIARLDKNDDFQDEKNWHKANPLLEGNQYMLNYLRSELKVALEQPEKMRNFLTKNLNIWLKLRENGYMKMDKFKSNIVKPEDIPDLTKVPCYVGVDLSSKIDITSASFVFRLDKDKYFVKQHAFIPEEAIKEKEIKDKVPYSLWIRQGWMTATPGDVVDYNFVEKYIEDMNEKYDIIEIDYDPWNATQFANNLADKGYETTEIRQGFATLSEPLKDFRENIYLGNIKYEDDPVFKWNMSNAVVKMDSNENIMLSKDKSINRIDSVVATICGYSRAMVNDGGQLDLNQQITDEHFEHWFK